MARRIFSWAVFPLVLCVSIAVAIGMIERGTSPFVALLSCQAGAFLLVFVLERIVPFHRSWNRSRGDIGVDAAHSVTVGVSSALLQPAIVAVGVALAASLSVWVGLGIWPHGWPLVLQLALALVIGELFTYWVHRLQHERDLLWRFHATHHSAPRLYWLNAGRFHFVDIAMNNIALSVPLVMLGATLEVFVLAALFAAVHGVFQHANLPLRLGPLNWIFSMAELHRWHHSPIAEEANHNYGQNLIVWDIVFGTRFLPEDREPPEEIGLEGLPTFPMTYWAQLASPFRWSEIKEESRRALQAAA